MSTESPDGVLTRSQIKEEREKKEKEMKINEMAKERAYHMYINNEHPDWSDEKRYEEAHKIETNLLKRNNACGICSYRKNLIDEPFKCQCYRFLCKECMINQVKTKLKGAHYIHDISYQNYTLKCPYSDCNHEYNISDYVSEEYFHSALVKIDIGDKIYQITECIKPDCGAPLKDDTCTICDSKVCFKCGGESHKDECNPETIKSVIELIKLGGKDMRQCPNCKIIIFKSGGCSGQFCWNCSNYFRWDIPTAVHRASNYSGQNYYKVFKKQREEDGAGRRIDG